MCRFSKLLLFSFFFCKDGSDRLMKRASYSCCNFLCVVLAAAYLKYRLCHLSCLPFVWHPFFHCDTPTRNVRTSTCTSTHTFTTAVLLILKQDLHCLSLSERLHSRQETHTPPRHQPSLRNEVPSAQAVQYQNNPILAGQFKLSAAVLCQTFLPLFPSLVLTPTPSCNDRPSTLKYNQTLKVACSWCQVLTCPLCQSYAPGHSC